MLDPAGEHTAGKPRLPETLCLPQLPPNSSAPNRVENLRQFLRQNKLSNRIFGADEAIVTAAGEACNSFVADPAGIASIATRQCATIAHD